MSFGPLELEVMFRSSWVSLDEMSPSEMSSLLFIADLVGLVSHGPCIASLLPEGAGGDAPSICASGFDIPL
jgi:hypothetical protein